MGGKSGGGIDTSAITQASNKALALNERIYDENVGRTEPFYEGGLSAFDMLLDRLGLQGGSVKTRDQLYDGMKDQYTTTTPTTYGDMWVGNDGALMTAEGIADSYGGPYGRGGQIRRHLDNPEMLSQIMESYGHTPMAMGGGETRIDYDALNAAVDERFAAQGDAPDNYGDLLARFDENTFREDPGYKFRLDQGQKAIERSMAANGMTFSPDQMKALMEHGQGVADQTYNDAFNRHNIENDTIFNRLASVAGIGQNANSQIVGAGNNYANAASNIYGQQANAITSAQVAQASQPSMFDTLINAGATVGAGYYMSDINAKENLEYVDTVNGHKRYGFNYKGNPDRYVGVIAQEVLRTHPEAVKRIDGVLHVNYDLIDVKMETLQ